MGKSASNAHLPLENLVYWVMSCQYINRYILKARKALMGAMASKWEDDGDSLDGEPIEREDGSSELDLKAAEERRQILR